MTLRDMACSIRSNCHLPTRRFVATSGIMLLLLALAGCGLSTATPSGVGYGPSSSPSVSAGESTRGATRTPTSVTGSVDNGAGSNRCPGGLSAITDIGAPQLILGADGILQGTIHPGELIQVRLPATTRWSFHNADTQAGLLQPAGYEDHQHNVCVWNFRPRSTTSLSLTFTGTALCTGKGLCPQYVFRETFSVQVK